jgi:hypothetical protein
LVAASAAATIPMSGASFQLMMRVWSGVGQRPTAEV